MLELHWNSPDDDKRIDTVVAKVSAWTEAKARERGLFNSFIYPNYASGDQDVYVNSLSTSSLAKMMRIKHKYDPEDVYGKLWKGGFKLPPSVADGYNPGHDRTEL